MDTEDLIEDALRLRADQAPPEGAVLAALHRPRKSRKPVFLAVAAATAAVAVAVVATTIGRPSAGAPPAGPGSVLPTTSPDASPTTAASFDPFTLGYSPSWLPDGLTERNRFVDATGGVQRVWKHDGGQVVAPSLELVVPKDAEAQELLHRQVRDAAAADQVVINGRTALVADPATLVTPLPGDTREPGAPDGTPPDTRVVLNPEPGRYLQFTLSNTADARAEAIRIAESMRPDPTSLRGPVSVGGEVAHQAGVNGLGWHVSTTGVVGGVTYGANLSSYVDEPIGNPGVAPVAVTARGASAEYLGERGGYLRVDLGPDLHLLVFGPGPGTTSAQDLVAVAEAVVLDPDPGLPWATP
ncbi:hypothetical protein [Saccharothrix sp. HUAS TT1]|uniref:hypothetical protein n=1 Tax=unclassified Saccharothrix TaxID=2593673 RepID=UPI00345BECFF